MYADYCLLAKQSPQAISAGMLRHPQINLNVQSQDATIHLIREVLAAGIELAEVCNPFISIRKHLEKTNL
jgi:hypothetical protein